MRNALAIGLILLLASCSSERHYARDLLWPFGNPNAPPATSETAERALGKTPDIAPIVPQAGDVWPGAVQPMPTLSDIQKNQNLPLGQGYTPSLPSPYPPGQGPDQAPPAGGNLYAVPQGAVPQTVPGN